MAGVGGRVCARVRGGVCVVYAAQRQARIQRCLHVLRGQPARKKCVKVGRRRCKEGNARSRG